MGRSSNTAPPSTQAGVLYVVATPIGNLNDITARAISTLQSVDLIASEDTRTIGRFLARLHIETRQISYFEGNEARRSVQIIEKMQSGQNVALVCESGTPAISDPGARLVAAAKDAELQVVPIPGPCAAIAALSASGLPTDRFLFYGFLPKSAKRRREALRALAPQPATLVFYESPGRIGAALTDMAAVLGGQRSAVVARELTKLHEELLRSTVSALAEHFKENPPRGEITLLVAGAGAQPLPRPEMNVRAAELYRRGLSTATIARRLSGWSGWTRKQVYDLVLSELKDHAAR